MLRRALLHGIHAEVIGFPATSQRHEYGDLILCQQGSGRCQGGFAGCQGALRIQCFKLSGLSVDIEGVRLPGGDGALISRGRERRMTFQLAYVDIERRFHLAQCCQDGPHPTVALLAQINAEVSQVAGP